MVTRRARRRDSIARVVVLGALALTVLFGGFEVASTSGTGHDADPHHAIIIARDTKTSVVAASTTRSRGTAWFASLVTAIGCAALAAYLFRAAGSGRARRNLQQYSIRLRAPPRLHVAN